MSTSRVLVRHEGYNARERSECGWRDRLISREDVDLNPAAWAHAVDIDGAKPHYHKVATELYYVLDGSGTLTVDGVDHTVCKGSLVHIPPGLVHSASGKCASWWSEFLTFPKAITTLQMQVRWCT